MSDVQVTPPAAAPSSVLEEVAALVRKHGKGNRELANLATDAAGLPQGVAEGSRKRNKRIILQMLADQSDGESGEEEGGVPGDRILLEGEVGSDEVRETLPAPPPLVVLPAASASAPGSAGATKSAGLPPGALTELASVLTQMNVKLDTLASRVVALDSELRSTQSELVVLRDHRPAAALKQVPSRKEVSPFAVAVEAARDDVGGDSESDSDVREAKRLLRSSLRKKAAKAAVTGKSLVRTDGLSGVESMEALMAAPGGVPSSLEHTLVLKLTVLMNDAPALYAKVPHFVKTDLRSFSRNYDRIRSELLAHRRDILASSALEAAAQDVQLRYLDAFVSNKTLLKAMKTVVRPEDDHLFQLMGGSPEKLTLMHSRAKQAAFLQGFGPGKQGQEDEEDPVKSKEKKK